jgi:thiamine pyrophosphokinase
VSPEFDYLIIAGGLCPPDKSIREFERMAVHTVTVDRGIYAAKKLKIYPLLHVGDDDSASPSAVKAAHAQAAIKLPKRKSVSDLEYALQSLPKNSRKLVIGAHRDHEGRTDHLFVNLMLVPNYPGMVYADEYGWITSPEGTGVRFSAPENTVFTLVTFTKTAAHISGARYNLRGKILATPTMGLSNQTKGRWTHVRTRSPALLFVSSPLNKTSFK